MIDDDRTLWDFRGVYDVIDTSWLVFHGQGDFNGRSEPKPATPTIPKPHCYKPPTVPALVFKQPVVRSGYKMGQRI